MAVRPQAVPAFEHCAARHAAHSSQGERPMPNAKHAALITGSNRNIGRACALILAKAGCNIVVNGSKDREAADSVAKEVEALGPRAIVAMGDVGRREDCMAIADTALKAFGTIDILVNNAAIREDGKFLE